MSVTTQAPSESPCAREPQPARPAEQLALPFGVAFVPTVIPRGDGSYMVSPGKPVVSGRVRVRVAARMLELSVPTVYRLIEEGHLKTDRPSPHGIRVHTASIQELLRATADAVDYWSKQG